MAAETVKIFPTIEELSVVCTKVKCSQENCSAIFQSTANLNMHLLKHHKIGGVALARKNSCTEYYCPVKTCTYHQDSSKYFNKLKYLKQHFLKVHATKNFVCEKCGKKFSTETFKNRHSNKECGKVFACTCGVKYNSTEAILTHCKRKGTGHSPLKSGSSDKVRNGEKPTITVNDDINKNEIKKVEMPQTPAKRAERLICPKLPNDVMSFPIHYIAAIALSELSKPFNLPKVADVGVQTDCLKMHHLKKNCNNLKPERKRKSSQQTQTVSGRCKNMKISTETQTSCDYLKNTKQKPLQKTPTRKRKKSMETQTKAQLFTNDVAGNRSATEDLADLKCLENTTKNSTDLLQASKQSHNQCNDKSPSNLSPITVKNDLLGSVNQELCINKNQLDTNFDEFKKVSGTYIVDHGSEGQIFDISKLCNIETQTEIDAFLTDCNDDTSFTLCSTTETQTTDDFDSLLYSNMCTQTSEDVDQLFNFNFVDIETQTAWSDLCSDLES